LRWLLRLPSLLFRMNLGWLLGARFVELTVRGRKSGSARRVVVEVIGRDSSGRGLLIASGWGARAQWYRNLEACPRMQAQVGRRRFAAEATILDGAEAARVLRAYARAHSMAYRWFIGPLLLGGRPTGTDDELARLARAVPVLLVREDGSRD